MDWPLVAERGERAAAGGGPPPLANVRGHKAPLGSELTRTAGPHAGERVGHVSAARRAAV